MSLFLSFSLCLSLPHRYHQGIILPRSNCSEIFVPLLRILDSLLVVGALERENDLKRLLILLDPAKFAPVGSGENIYM